MKPSPGRIACALAAVLGCAVASVLWPVFTYALSLALFGLPHVACELRYLDQRFGSRLSGSLWRSMATLLIGIALLRVAGLAHLGTAHVRSVIELLLGAVLATALLPRLRLRGAPLAVLGLATAAAAILGAALAPTTALVLFALLHNVTPVGLLCERLRGGARIAALLASAVAFLLVPLAIASGLLGGWLADLGCHASIAGPWSVGELDQHLGAFVPESWRGTEFGDDLFAAAAFLQCMHYVVVIAVLPKLGPGEAPLRSRLPWPAPRGFIKALVVATAMLLVAYLVSFANARACYGVFASVHAWVEVPILLLACVAPPLARAPEVAVA